MKIDFRQGVVSHQETGFLEPNGSGGVRIAASTRSTTITLAHRDTNYTHSEDNNVENAWPGPFPAGDNYYLYWEFNQLTFLRSFGYTTLEPVSQSVPPGSGNSPIIAAVPGVASPVSFGSFEVQGHFDLPVDKVFAVVGSTGSPNNDGMYTVKTAVYNLVTGNTTITVNEAVATATASGELTLDIDSTGLPLFVTGRNWYDTANHINYVLDISNQWVEVLRVYAANLFGGTTFLSMSQTGNFTGTQIGDNSPVASGRVLFGDAGNPIRRDDNTFFTTEDQFFTNQSRVDAIRLESNVSRAQAFSSSLAQFGIVAWRDDGQIASATYDDTGNTVVGVLTESILVGQVGAVITQGTVTNSAWNWTATLSVGAKLWILDGGLVGIDPNVSDPNTYSTKQVAVARVLGIDTIIFEQGLGGVGPQGATGSISDLPVATTSELGVVFLSHAATNPLIPIAVGENHPVITGGPYSPISHSHTALQTSFTPGNNIAASDVQNAIAELAIEKLNLSGGTMTGPGFLTLANTPTDEFHAATKAYVDALFQGIDAKEACLVGTTEALGDIGGLYSSIGGTGGTGSIADALVSQLDGENAVDFILGVGARILIKDQDDAKENGIYSITALGAGSPITTIDIERASDFDSNEEIRAGNYTVLRSGLEQAGQGWVLTDIHPDDDIELNLHAITWTLVSAAASYLGDPNTISIDLANVISVIPASGSPSGQVDAKFWLGNEILITSPTNGDSLVYNDSSLKWENAPVVNPLGDLTVVSIPASDTIISTKDIFALQNSNGGVSITTTGVEVTGILSFAAEGSPSTSPQIVLPNYVGSPAALPATTLEGGMVWDSTTKAVTVYDGTAWTAVGGGSDQTPWLSDIDANGFSLVTENNLSGDALDIFLQSGNSAGYGNEGGDINLTGGNGTDYGDGGAVTLTGGLAAATIDGDQYQYGGAIQLYGGTTTYSGDAGGEIFVYGGGDYASGGVRIQSSAPAVGSDSGWVRLNTGNTTGNGGSGTIALTGGDNTDTGNGGSIRLEAGSSKSAFPGNITITSGWAGSSSTVNGGTVNIRAAHTNSSSVTSSGGDVEIFAGRTVNNTLSGGSISLTPGSNGDNSANGVVNIHSGETFAGEAVMRFWKDTNTGHTTGNYVALKASASQASNTIFELPISNGADGEVLTRNVTGGTEWAAAGGTTPTYEKIVIGGSPVSQVLTTAVTVTATAGSPIQSASIQVFRNGILQNEDTTSGSPIDGDFEVTGTNELTFAPDSLQPGGVIIIYVFG